MSVPERQGLYDPRFEHEACGVGIVCNIDGRPSHEIIQRGLQVLVNLTHRGATGSDAETGDGAGILMQIPHAFLERECASLGIRLPEPGEYGVGTAFLPTDAALRALAEAHIERTVADLGQHFLGWRDVPVHPEHIGDTARRRMPAIRQFFVLRGSGLDAAGFERKLYVIRKVVEHALRSEGVGPFHVPSLSSRTLVYKGLLLAYQVKKFYSDLADPAVESGLALVHQRYSTNTWPTWDRAHPYRYLCHNGEINTVRGNHNWMRAREAVIRSGVWGDDLPRILPLVNPDTSDSGMVDNVLEFLVLSGRDLAHAVMMLIPEAWDRDPLMRDEKKAFYEYHQCLVEPWDGPASIAFSDGTRIGAVLDRNGLRPSRYWVTKDGFVVLSSECGVLPINPEDVKYKGRLQPGRMLLIDTSEGRIIPDEELKSYYARRRPYRQWLRDNLTRLEDLAPRSARPGRDGETDRHTRQKLFGYTLEDLRILLAPMAANGVEADGSMGNDTPIAALSERPQLLFNYFKQGFAQVTNPPIDSIREDSVMSLISTVGAEGNLLDETPEHARLLELEQPILSAAELEKIRQIDHPWLRAATLDCTFEPPAANGEELAAADAALRGALDRLRAEAAAAVRGGASILVLSDRAAGRARAAVPSLLATSAVHHHLSREGLRMRCGIVVETGDAREVAHFALLIGFGAAAVHPYLAFESIRQLVADSTWVPAELTPDKAEYNYVKAIGKGLLKIFAKMGISTLHSYRGAQIFEAVGIDEPVVNEFFTDTATRIGGVDARSARARGAPATRIGVPARGGGGARSRPRRRVPVAARRRAPPAEPDHDPPAAERGAPQRRRPVPRLRQGDQRPEPRALHDSRPAPLQERRNSDPDRGGRARGGDHEALLHGRDELRLDQRRGARDARHRDEPDRRQVQQRRGRRGPQALHPRPERRLAAQRDQAGRVGPLRRVELVPGQRRRAPDQDRARRQARRRRPAPRLQGRTAGSRACATPRRASA